MPAWNIDILCVKCDAEEVAAAYNALQELFDEIRPVISRFNPDDIGRISVGFAPGSEPEIGSDWYPVPKMIMAPHKPLNNTRAVIQTQLRLILKDAASKEMLVDAYPIDEDIGSDEESDGSDDDGVIAYSVSTEADSEDD